MSKKSNYALVNCNIFDGNLDSELVKDGIILIKNITESNEKSGIIEKVGARNQVIIPPDYEEVDLQGSYVIPGLINAHAHMMGEGKPRKITSRGDKTLKRLAWLLRRWIGKKIMMRMMKQHIISA